MNGDWILILKIISGLSLSGALAAVCLAIRHIRIAQIQKDKDKVVELRIDPDGSKELIIRGYSREDEAKIVQQLSQIAVDFLRAGNAGLASKRFS